MSEQLITTDGEVTGLQITGDAFVTPVTKEEIEERQRKLQSLDEIDVSTGTSIVSTYWEARQGIGRVVIFASLAVLVPFLALLLRDAYATYWSDR